MDPNWTISYGGTTRTLAAAGISNLKGSFRSMLADVLTFDFPGAFDADPGLVFGQKVTINKISSAGASGIVFVGYVTTLPRRASGLEESVSIRLEGPWYFLEQLVYQQVWKLKTGSNQFAQQNNAHLLLNLNSADLTLMTTGAQIKLALQYLLDRFQAGGKEKPFQIGNVTLALQPPIDEVRDVTCAEVIRREMARHPDAVSWFDYATDPPTFHCRPYAELPAVSVKVEQTTAFDLTPRYDLQRSAVAVRYETKNSIDGQDFIAIRSDSYPLGATGLEVNALTATVDLEGISITTLKAEIVTAAIPADLTDLSWWKARIEELRNDRAGPITVISTGRVIKNPDGTTSPSDGMPFEVLEGQIAPWMRYNGVPAAARQERFTIQVKYQLLDADGTPLKAFSNPREFSFDCVTTNLPTGSYKAVATQDTGDPQPVGMAQYLYVALQILHFDGTIEITEPEAGDVFASVGIGKLLNIPNGRPEWAAMGAMIQTVEKDYDHSISRFQVGPPAHLSIGDIVDLLRVNRGRLRWTNPDAVGGAASASSDGTLGKQTANSQQGSADAAYQLLVVRLQGGCAITLDAAGKVLKIIDGLRGALLQTDRCVGGGQDRMLSIQETAVCVTNPDGTKSTKHRLGVFSDIY